MLTKSLVMIKKTESLIFKHKIKKLKSVRKYLRLTLFTTRKV